MSTLTIRCNNHTQKKYFTENRETVVEKYHQLQKMYNEEKGSNQSGLYPILKIGNGIREYNPNTE